MKKLLLVIGAAVALAVPASAQSPVVATSNCNNCAQAAPTGPVVSSGYATPSVGRKFGFFGIFGGSGKVPPPPPAMGGQLVFPQHPFVRSPRDFFMQ